MKLGIVGGGGWLGGAIAKAALSTGLVTPADLSLSSRRVQSARFPKSFWTADNQALADRSEVIILSVRPADWPAVAMDAGGKLVISVMAGITLESIITRHKTARVIRTLPNAAAEVGKSYTPWVASNDAISEDRAVVRAIFSACGVEDEVGTEREIDYLTGLTGSGPAFPALLAATMIEHATTFGLPREVAEKAAMTVIIGTGRLMERRREKPEDLVEAFLQYRGTTAAAIETMRSRGFDSTIAAGLQSAFEKSLLMGRTDKPTDTSAA